MQQANHAQVKYRGWLIWLLAGLFYLFEFLHRVAPSVMGPELMHDFQVSAATLGSLSAYYFYAYATIQIPIGIFFDKYGARNLLTFAAALVALGSLLFAMTNSLAMAKLSRLLIGLGSAFSFVGCLKIGTTWFPAKRLALIIGLTNLLGVTGAILGGKPLAYWVDIYHWRSTLFASTLIALLFCLLLWHFIRDSPSYAQNKLDLNTVPLSTQIKSILVKPQLWLVSLYAGLMVAPIAAYAELWGVTYLMHSNQLNKPNAAALISMIFVGIAIGGPTIGWLSDKLQKRKPLMIIGCVGAFICTILILTFPSPQFIFLTSLHLMFGFFTSVMLLCFSLNTEQVHGHLRGTVIGFTNTLVMAGGACFQPIVGLLIDSLTVNGYTSLSSYQFALSSLLVCQLLAATLLFWVKDKRIT